MPRSSERTTWWQPNAPKPVLGASGAEVAGAVVAGTAVWGLAGYGLDRWLGTWPALFVIGAVLGNAAGVYSAWLKTKAKLEAVERSRKRARGELVER
ncbi:MAG TPA: AtpZ/AtpI family protein [Actinomycetota bacterium]